MRKKNTEQSNMHSKTNTRKKKKIKEHGKKPHNQRTQKRTAYIRNFPDLQFLRKQIPIRGQERGIIFQLITMAVSGCLKS